MNNWPLYLLILLVFGVIVSNMLAIKRLDNIKVPPLLKKQPSLSAELQSKLDKVEKELQLHQSRPQNNQE
ncbi:DUF2897 family protein [Ferrimonas lipolytica]|uniref:DUF2897 family protein n=1 Tax=Ferrimonas lipolytica TaxID=2724191 RepID=A0A6H1UFA6_9GAMM|nr:DUF2897 family protein [Ferrimonas lipolytica]QIZ76896.1 DUF2897 family protein [Ferrimonas lipolytica]